MRHSDMECWSTGAAKKRQNRAPPSVALPKDRCAGKSVGRNTQSSRSAASLHPPSFHSSSRQPAGGKQASSLFWHTDLKVYVSPRSDNEPLKNGNRATACRSSIC